MTKILLFGGMGAMELNRFGSRRTGEWGFQSTTEEKRTGVAAEQSKKVWKSF